MANEHERPTAQIIEALHAVLRQVSEPNVVLAAILEQAVKRTGAERGLFVEVLDDGDMNYRVLHGFQASHFEGEAGGFSRNLFGRVLHSGEGVLLDRAADDPYFGSVASVRSLKTSAILCMPIRIGPRIAGIVHLEHRRAGHFREEHRGLLGSLLAVAGPVLETLTVGRAVIQERDRLRLSEQQLRQEAEESRALLERDWSFGRFVGRSKAVRALEEEVQRAAATDYPVLLLGEPGTGKSMLARVLHYGGLRAKRPLVTVHGPSLEKGMVEAELFGHRKGAFTGALGDRVGKVQSADGGTLFLDEIGDLPLEIQPKLLRLLQEKAFERVGDTQERTADVRIIAATNRELAQEVERGRFRRDLYDRLNFLPIRVPPLRERTEDIPLLLRYSLDRSGSARWIELSAEALEFLQRLDFSWPGNVRHVEQLAARLTAESRREPVTAHDIERLLRVGEMRHPSGTKDAGADAGRGAGLPAVLAEAERTWLEEALRNHSHLTRAELAARLGISESSLYRKLSLYRIGE